MSEQKEYIERDALLDSLKQTLEAVDDVIWSAHDETVIARHRAKRSMLVSCIARVKEAPAVDLRAAVKSKEF